MGQGGFLEVVLQVIALVGLLDVLASRMKEDCDGQRDAALYILASKEYGLREVKQKSNDTTSPLSCSSLYRFTLTHPSFACKKAFCLETKRCHNSHFSSAPFGFRRRDAIDRQGCLTPELGFYIAISTSKFHTHTSLLTLFTNFMNLKKPTAISTFPCGSLTRSGYAIPAPNMPGKGSNSCTFPSRDSRT